MSTRELQRVEVLGRVASKTLKLVNAAEILQLSYRQGKRLWRRYQPAGGEGLKHGNAARSSNQAKPERFRRQVLRLVRKKYSGGEEERFGPTLAAEHLAEEDGLQVDGETLRRWMLAEGVYGAGSASARPTASGASASRTLANWCNWRAASTTGLRGEGRTAA
jgi:transposase